MDPNGNRDRRRLRCAGHGRRHGGDGQADRARSRATRSTASSADLTEAAIIAHLQTRSPTRTPSLRRRHHAAGLRPVRLPAHAEASRPAARRRLHPGARDPRQRSGAGRQTEDSAQLLLLRRLRPRDPEEDSGRAGTQRDQISWTGGRRMTSARAGWAAAGRSSTTRASRSASTSRSSADTHRFEFDVRRRASARSCSTTRSSAWSPRCTRTTPGRRSSSTRGGRRRWDVNDTVADRPIRRLTRMSSDFFRRLAGRRVPADLACAAASPERWASAERDAAEQGCRAHADTPTVAHFDTLGRPS